jgi:polar amino acid transport system permease protein
VNVELIWNNLPQLLRAFWVTLELAAVSIIGSTAIGLVVGGVRTSKVPIASQLARAYVEIFRGSPLPITLLFVYFGAALYLGFSANLFGAAAVGLSIYHGAYVAELLRSGIEAVPVGHREAARTLGLSQMQIFRFVVLPQTRRIVLPPLVGQYISLIKDTSIAFVIGLVELMKAGQAIVDRTADPIPIYLTIAALYFVTCYPLSLWVRRHERKLVPA